MNNTIWEHGEKPIDEDIAFKDCKSFYAPLWDAIQKGTFVGDEDFHPIKEEAKTNTNQKPTTNG